MKEQKFYAKKWFCILTLIFFAPVGIFLLWKYKHFSPKVSKILAVASIVFFIYALITAPSNEFDTDDDTVKTTSENNEIAEAPAETTATTDTPKKETTSKNTDIVPENFLNDVKSAIKGSIGENESIADVTFKNKDLCIYVDFSQADPTPLTIEDLAVSRTSSITDNILELNKYDTLWKTITVDFGKIGKIVNTRKNIETNDYGRYFPSENFKLE